MGETSRWCSVRWRRLFLLARYAERGAVLDDSRSALRPTGAMPGICGAVVDLAAPGVVDPARAHPGFAGAGALPAHAFSSAHGVAAADAVGALSPRIPTGAGPAQAEGVNSQPAPRGQFSTGLDSRDPPARKLLKHAKGHWCSATQGSSLSPLERPAARWCYDLLADLERKPERFNTSPMTCRFVEGAVWWACAPRPDGSPASARLLSRHERRSPRGPRRRGCPGLCPREW
jgi:hypothetical protein